MDKPKSDWLIVLPEVTIEHAAATRRRLRNSSKLGFLMRFDN